MRTSSRMRWSTWSACRHRSLAASGITRPNGASRSESAKGSQKSANAGRRRMTFRTLETGVPRRALLLMPLAYFGLDAIFDRKERPLPNAPVGGARVILSEAEWKNRLTPQEFSITRRGGTEFAYTGRYWNNHERGVYRCVCCGSLLFRSEEKFDSGTGWPS